MRKQFQIVLCYNLATIAENEAVTIIHCIADSLGIDVSFDNMAVQVLSTYRLIFPEFVSPVVLSWHQWKIRDVCYYDTSLDKPPTGSVGSTRGLDPQPGNSLYFVLYLCVVGLFLVEAK